MPTPDENLLARLARSSNSGPDNPWSFVEATPPKHERPTQIPEEEVDKRLEKLLRRVKSLTDAEAGTPASTTPPLEKPAPRPSEPAVAAQKPAPSPIDAQAQIDKDNGTFLPQEPTSLHEAQVAESLVEGIILKYLLMRGDATGRDISDQVKLPFVLIEPLLRQMKFDRMLGYRDTTAMNDYVYQLTDTGRERAKRLSDSCTYFGAAPISLSDYTASVRAQTLENQHPNAEDLKRAFSDLLINPSMLLRLGPAINSGRGMFLYGYPGNGKTSIAERVTRAFGRYIWIPRCIGVDGEIIRIYDPMVHTLAPEEKNTSLLSQSKVDRRWIKIERPTIVVGGELTMDNLEVSFNTATGISEAPMQMKSNCGTLVIDDFGRQKMRTDELLNRWIVPLEKRVDYLNLATGKKIQVPFDQLVVFSTNLQPKDLVDDAFLRRIPYKIEVPNPTEAEYRQLFKIMASKFGIEYREEAVTYLVENHYKKINRPFRCCQPRDLLSQVVNYCRYCQKTPEMTREAFDFAVANYFAVME